MKKENPMKSKNNLPVMIQLFYGLGVSYAIVDQIFVQWVLYYYLPPESSGLKPLIAPVFITIALIISRFVDMIFDPLIGYLSDNLNTRWGRRIPFIAIGGIPLALCTIGFFYPIFFSSTPVYLTLMGSLFFIFYSIVGAPYNALIPEIANNRIDRLNLSTWQSIFRLAYTAMAMILPGILIKHFGNGNTELGIRRMVIFLSIFSLIGMYITVFGVRERKYGKADIHQKKVKFFHALTNILKDKAFILYLFGLLFFFIGFNTLRTCINYYVEDIMGLGKEYLTIISAILFGTSALFFYPINLISRRIGYRKLMLASLVMLIALSLVLFNLGKTIPVSWGYIIFALIGIPISGSAFIFPPAMLSEIVTYSSKSQNLTMEGLYFGIQGFFLKFAFLISVGIIPFLLVSGDNINFTHAFINQGSSVQQTGIYNTTLFATIAFIIATIFYYLYPERIESNQ